jgi:hypothetical protein
MPKPLVVATEILHQLGGGRLQAMTGARNFVGSEDALSFRIPKAKRGINYVRVTLDPADTYTMTFRRIHGMTIKDVCEMSGVYHDQLSAIFEETTGLRTSLGTMRGAA